MESKIATTSGKITETIVSSIIAILPIAVGVAVGKMIYDKVTKSWIKA